MPNADPPRVLTLAHDTLKPSNGVEAAVALSAAVSAVAYESAWLHTQLQNMGADAVLTASVEEYDIEPDARSAPRQLNEKLGGRLKLLCWWETADGKRAAQPGVVASRIPACMAAHSAEAAFAARFATLCEHASLVDAYAPRSDVKRWLSLIWQAACKRPSDFSSYVPRDWYWD